MDIKIFSAEHKNTQSDVFQDARKITPDKFKGEIWIVAGFKHQLDLGKKIYNQVVEILDRDFKEKESEDVFEHLEESLKEINEKVKEDAQELGIETMQEGGILIALFADNELHFTLCGSPEIYFIRKGKFAVVSEGLYDRENEDLFANVAGGDIQDNDKVLFTTSRLLRHATGKQLADAVSGGVLESIEALKFIIPDEEAVLVEVFHTKGMETLPFNTDDKPKYTAAAGSYRKRGAGFDLVGEVQKFFRKISSGNYPLKQVTIGASAILGVILIVLFLSSFVGGQEDELQNQHKLTIEKIRDDFKTIEVLKLEDKTAEANQKLKNIEERALQINEDGYFQAEVLEILNAVQKSKDDINDIRRVTGAKPIINLPEKDLQGVFQFGEENFVYGSEELVEVIAANGEEKKTVAFPQGEKITRGVSLEAKDMMVFLTQSNKIVEVEGNEARFATTEDDTFKNAVDISTFSRYIYLLEPAENQIWKYERRDSGFTSALEYNLGADLSKASSLAIDGNIFVFTTDGQLIKLYRGQEQDYQMRNLPDNNLSGVSKIYTNEELDKIFLLDEANKRILVLTKGENEAYYEEQIIVEDVTQIRDIWVSSGTNRLFYVDDSKLYAIGL